MSNTQFNLDIYLLLLLGAELITLLISNPRFKFDWQAINFTQLTWLNFQKMFM